MMIQALAVVVAASVVQKLVLKLDCEGSATTTTHLVQGTRPAEPFTASYEIDMAARDVKMLLAGSRFRLCSGNESYCDKSFSDDLIVIVRRTLNGDRSEQLTWIFDRRSKKLLSYATSPGLTERVELECSAT